MKVLMIALSDGILCNPVGDVRERHLDYAERAGTLFMIVYSPRRRDLLQRAFSPRLKVYPTRSLTPWHFIPDALRIACRIIEKEGADLITAQDPFASGLVGYLLKKRYRIPLEVQNHSSFFDDPAWMAERPLRYRCCNKLGKIVIQEADMLRVINCREGEKYQRLGIPARQIRLLPTPVRLERFLDPVPVKAMEKLRRQRGIAPGEKVIIWAGRPVACKGLPLWLETLALLCRCRGDVRGVVLGDLGFSPGLPRMAQDMGLQGTVVFPGRIDHDQLPPWFALADVYLHTSLYEGLGKALVEAGAAGLPVVSSPTAGAYEVLEEGITGIICRNRAVSLAKAVITLLDDPLSAERMGAAAQKRVRERFDREKALAAIVHAWRETVALKQSPDAIKEVSRPVREGGK